MSADNGIYITQWNDGYRVAEASAIENIDFINDSISELENKRLQDEYRKSVFGRSEVFKTEDEAFDRARAIYSIFRKRGWPVEYGIIPLGYFGEFPK